VIPSEYRSNVTLITSEKAALLDSYGKDGTQIENEQ